ncbi:MAG: hypothetical protein KF685_05060 [Acidobacteria bacterium]|nr:hypothetical protein [Acidobacteriota bacterium]
MKLLLSGGILLFVMTMCGLGERLEKLRGSSDTNTAPTTEKRSTSTVKQADMTPSQQAIADKGVEIAWAEQGIKWKVPENWPKMDVGKDSLNYGAPAEGFLIASISVMPSSFPAETSLDATYQSALEQMKQGKYEEVNWLEIDGVKGVEWVEAMPEDKDGPRRHQWIAFRNYQGQNQQLNIMVSTKGSNFDNQKDTFAAILYSMQIPKG